MTPDELFSVGRMLAALVFVLALMGGLAVLVKKLGLSGVAPHLHNQKRLKVVEVLPLDARRRLILIQCDDEQHLIVLGPGGETVIKTGIRPAAAATLSSYPVVDASAKS